MGLTVYESSVEMLEAMMCKVFLLGKQMSVIMLSVYSNPEKIEH